MGHRWCDSSSEYCAGCTECWIAVKAQGFDRAQYERMSGETLKEIVTKRIRAQGISILPDGRMFRVPGAVKTPPPPPKKKAPPPPPRRGR